MGGVGAGYTALGLAWVWLARAGGRLGGCAGWFNGANYFISGAGGTTMWWVQLTWQLTSRLGCAAWWLDTSVWLVLVQSLAGAAAWHKVAAALLGGFAVPGCW